MANSADHLPWRMLNVWNQHQVYLATDINFHLCKRRGNIVSSNFVFWKNNTNHQISSNIHHIIQYQFLTLWYDYHEIGFSCVIDVFTWKLKLIHLGEQPIAVFGLCFPFRHLNCDNCDSLERILCAPNIISIINKVTIHRFAVLYLFFYLFGNSNCINFIYFVPTAWHTTPLEIHHINWFQYT